MTNNAIFHKMIAEYNELSFTHEYIFGFADNGSIWACYATSEILPYVCTLDSASRNGGYSIRFRPTVAQKEILKSGKTQLICSEAYFNEIVKGSKYNNGEIFEMLITESFGQKWEKDNIPFTEAGDIEVNGIAYHIKFNKATFISEAGLRKAWARR